MKTLILTGKDVEKILTPRVVNETVEKAFRAYGLGSIDMPAKTYLYFPKGDLRSMPAYIFGAVLISLLAGVAGLITSFYWGTATGATIVLWAMGFFILSLLFRRR